MSVQTDIKLIDNASKVLASIETKVDSLSDKVDLINQKPIMPKDMPDTEKGFGRLIGRGKNLLGIFSQFSMTLYGVKEIFNGIANTVGTITKYSDTLSETTARLNLMNDGLMSTDMLWSDIYDSSMRSRGSIVDTADTVAKMGIVTKGVFKNNKELIQFTENLTKSFKISGTSTQGISSAMLQLTQAMSSGVLRGEELNSIFENAPLLIQNISDYMNVPIGQIRELASEGKITADIVKNAILGATDEINAKFDEMPMKFDELGIQFENIWYNNMQMIQDDLEGIPQSIADNVLPIWDAFTYALFTDLEGVYKAQEKGINNTAGAYARFAEQVSVYTGIIIDENQAMKIQFVSSFEIFESLFKKTINILNEAGDYFFDMIDYAATWLISRVVNTINEIAVAIDSFTNGVTNLSSTTSNWASYWSEQESIKWNDMSTYENTLNDKYFGVPIWELPNTITEEAINKVILDDLKKDPNSLFNSYLFTGKENINVPFAGYYPETPEYLKKDKNKYKSASFLDLPTTFPDLPTTPINNIAKDVSDISSSVKSLNDVNKAIMEINEATYHNNIANQFTGNIQVISYGTGEEEQKAIGKVTEDAVRKVIFNDYQNTQAMGVYA